MRNVRWVLRDAERWAYVLSFGVRPPAAASVVRRRDTEIKTVLSMPCRCRVFCLCNLWSSMALHLITHANACDCMCSVQWRGSRSEHTDMRTDMNLNMANGEAEPSDRSNNLTHQVHIAPDFCFVCFVRTAFWGGVMYVE